jgi:hypothetical protein
MAGVVGHVSSLSGVPLREDPVVLGWQLAEGPQHPGHPSSDALMVRSKKEQLCQLFNASCRPLFARLLAGLPTAGPHLAAKQPDLKSC